MKPLKLISLCWSSRLATFWWLPHYHLCDEMPQKQKPESLIYVICRNTIRWQVVCWQLIIVVFVLINMLEIWTLMIYSITGKYSSSIPIVYILHIKFILIPYIFMVSHCVCVLYVIFFTYSPCCILGTWPQPTPPNKDGSSHVLLELHNQI